jgi:hypothetical protein
MRRKKGLALYVGIGAAVVIAATALVYYWMQLDPRLQIGMSEKEVSELCGNRGTAVHLDRAPANAPLASYYVVYEQHPDLFGNSRVVTAYFDRGGRLVKYEVSPLPP